ncbi:dynamin family protein [Delphinella strobiligena]|nr:dynamin family protein [Delphinella strobiligena]
MSSQVAPAEESNFVISNDHGKILNAIDQLRAHGVSHYVSLPQLIVTGDQSAGKSSVLEAISKVRFPTKDNLCTQALTIGITPDPDRSEDEKAELAKFHVPDAGLDQLADLTEKAQEVMGLKEGSTTFGKDVLKIEITGPEQPNLTLVDLPSLIHAENENQSKADIEVVSDLVQKYMENPRSIILAVISAKSDYANQAITTRAHAVDPLRLRTMGIITKPDTLDIGSEMERDYADLLRTEKARGFRLGWHALQNRGFKSKNFSDKERDEAETKFFSQGIWTAAPTARLGIASLELRLSDVLKDQITSQLPSLLQDVEQGIKECQEILAKLGDARATSMEQRTYLAEVCRNFSAIVKEAVDRIYNDPFFGSASSAPGQDKRLRAVVQGFLLGFSKKMQKDGQDRKIVDHEDDEDDEDDEKPSLGIGTVSRKAFIKEVQTLMSKNRGRELPGTFNPMLIGELFHQHTSPWQGIVEESKRGMVDTVRNFVETALGHVTDDETQVRLFQQIIGPALDGIEAGLDGKVDEILQVHQRGHPITYNHYFTETIQKARQDYQEQQITKAVVSWLGSEFDDAAMSTSFSLTGDMIISALKRRAEPDMDLHACFEATNSMEAYYKVALKLLVDNFAQLCIEGKLLVALPGLLSLNTIMSLDDKDLQSIAGETEECQRERSLATSKLKSLQSGLIILRKFGYHRITIEEEDAQESDAKASGNGSSVSFM